jgi:hypothetical protein
MNLLVINTSSFENSLFNSRIQFIDINCGHQVVSQSPEFISFI